MDGDRRVAAAAGPARPGGIWTTALALFAATRAGYLLLTYFAVTLGGRSHGALSYLTAWNQWDTHWFLQIARAGYTERSQAAFFPLYPLLVGALSWPLEHLGGGETIRLAVAMVVSNAGTLVAMAGLLALARRDLQGEASDLAAVRFLVAYPFAFYLFAAYSEGLFLAAAAWALVMARKGRWLPAAALTFVAALTRVTAVVLILPLLWEFGAAQGWVAALRFRRGPARLSRRALLDLAALLAAVPLAIAVFAAGLAARFNDPLLFLHVQGSQWHRVPQPLPLVLLTAFRRVLEPGSFPAGGRAMEAAELGAVLLFALVTVLALRRLPVSYALYTACLILLALASPIPSGVFYLQSAGRFMVAGIPAFLGLAALARHRPGLETLLLSSGLMLQGLFVSLFLAGAVVE